MKTNQSPTPNREKEDEFWGQSEAEKAIPHYEERNRRMNAYLDSKKNEIFPPLKQGDKLLERCGFCGEWFIGDEYATIEQLKSYNQEQLNSAPLGYCPNAHYEDPANINEGRRVTKDMAIDAGQPELEGQLL